MKYILRIQSQPSSTNMHIAFQFVEALLQEKQTIQCVFFTEDGVYQAIQRPIIWKEFSVPLWVCSSACEIRGILNNIPPEFKISGLGEWMNVFLECDRVITFP